ncbi:CPBP family intramembrane metalloprotease [Thalassotalea sp. LPB0316]|uniref:CPBP family intramembrane glutamic endopeptidase n=1 Tax=Thalassotalea sp. LPB0316 TaxID=2769490 RepID=UPI001866FAC1|nr:CPBP family intramembrane glutamic endopeptidase [Thalassotalea sp. LPB0316]QOL24983.1 CPBP family intramembrane metalloprotease [Thalassotalea sp. LPB0316]
MNSPTKLITPENAIHKPSPLAFLLDLVIYISIMFLVREIYFSQFNFITNGLFWSFVMLLTATILMRLRNVSWKEIGLFKPSNVKKSLLATIFIFAFTIISILIFQTLKDQLGLQLSPDMSNETAVSKFGDLSGNWKLFFTIMPFIWLQSALEEILDRGFLINWIEKALSSTWFATIFAVLAQALIFGFRHSYDISERSITVAIIGLAMGIGYVAFGRNLWPLIFVHCLLNTMSMLDRV